MQVMPFRVLEMLHARELLSYRRVARGGALAVLLVVLIAATVFLSATGAAPARAAAPAAPAALAPSILPAASAGPAEARSTPPRQAREVSARAATAARRSPLIRARSLRAGATTSQRTRPPAAVAAPPAPTPRAPAAHVLFGAATPDLASLDRLTSVVHHRAALYMYYRQWATAPSFDASFASAVRARGALPEITWEPWDPRKGVSQPAYALDRITAGAFDGYLTTWAKGIRSWGHPIVLRFAHEMNGNWYPWSEGVNGNSAGDYVRAWRHVKAVFQAAGATNVQWLWCPNIGYPGSVPLSQLYPGDGDVDLVGLDGYNGGTALPWGGWRTFDQLFDPSLAVVRALSAKPIVIGEVGSTEAGGSKAGWIAGFFAALAANPDITAFTWFDFNKETDWRVESSASSIAAFAAGLANQRYA